MHDLETAMMTAVGNASDKSDGNQRSWEYQAIEAELAPVMNKKQMIQCQQNLVQQGFLRNEENIKDRVFQFVLAPKGMQWWLLESDRQAYFSDAKNIKDQFALTPNAEKVASALGLHAKRVLRIMYAIDLP